MGTTHSFILSPWSTSHTWHCFLQNTDFEKSAWRRPVEQLIPVGCTFVSNTGVVADVLSGLPATVSQLCSTAKPVVSLLQMWILSVWIYLPGCASSLGWLLSSTAFPHEVELQNWPLLLDSKHNATPSIPRPAGTAATWRFVCKIIFTWLYIFNNNKVHWSWWLNVKWGQDQFYSRRTNGYICDLNIKSEWKFPYETGEFKVKIRFSSSCLLLLRVFSAEGTKGWSWADPFWFFIHCSDTLLLRTKKPSEIALENLHFPFPP